MGSDESYSDWHRQLGSRDATTGQESWVFALKSERVIHPGMSIAFTGVHFKSPDFMPGEYVELDCTLYCEGCAPVKRLIQGRLQQA